MKTILLSLFIVVVPFLSTNFSLAQETSHKNIHIHRSSTIEEAISALKSENPETKFSAVRYFSRDQEKAKLALIPLTETLSDKDQRIVIDVAKAIAKIAPPETKKKIIEALLVVINSNAISTSKIRALRIIQQLDTEELSAVKGLAEYVENGKNIDPYVKYVKKEGANAITEILKTSKEATIKNLSSNNSSLTTAAFQALKTFNWEKEDLNAFLNLANNKIPEVRHFAFDKMEVFLTDEEIGDSITQAFIKGTADPSREIAEKCSHALYTNVGASSRYFDEANIAIFKRHRLTRNDW